MKKKLLRHFFVFLKKRKIYLIMVNLFFFLALINMQLQAGMLGQKTVSMNLQDASLYEMLESIEEQTGVGFLYNESEINTTEKINVNVNNEPLVQVLGEVLSELGVDFELDESTIVLTAYQEQNGDESEMVESNSEKEETIEIKGKITDKDGFPLPGTTILEEGTTTGVTTDVDGNFLMEVTSTESVLKISYIGFTSQSIVVGDQTVFNIVLKESETSLAEVVVTGYQTISRERATGSFVKISTDQIEKPASSISERLVGSVAGLQSTTDAYGNIDFEIRGQTSLFADQQPLIVVDGFAIEGDFQSINPNDVESITVLKDAAAASIWGAKSANGVIVITTKQAKKGQAKVSVSSFMKFSGKLDLDYVNPTASSEGVIGYEQAGFNTQFFAGPWGYPSATVSSLGSYSQAVNAMNEARLGRITTTERDAILTRLKNQNNKSQIEDYLLQAPVTQQYNINISGGNDRMVNSLSLMFEDSKNFFKENQDNKYLINYRNKINVTKWLDFEFSGMIQYNKRTNNGVSLSDIKALAPFDMLLNNDGSKADMSYLNYYMPNMNEFVPMDEFPYSDWSYNPLTEIKNRDISTTNLNTRIQTGLTFKIIKGLTYATKIQYELFTTNNRSYYNENSFTVRQFVNETSGWNKDFNTNPTQNIPNGGVLQQNSTTTKAYNFRNQLNFVRVFNQVHAVNVVAGSEISSRVTEYTRNPDALGYNDDKLTTGELLNPAVGSRMWNGYPLRYIKYFYPFNIAPTHSFSYREDRYFSLYANAAYTYDDKYTLTASIRTDASNLITDDPKYRYSPFWSVGLGWQLGKEDFMSHYDWLDQLNVRLTYGYNGNVDKSTSFLPLINVNGTLNLYTQETTASVSSYGNPTLRWEKTNTFDLGFDFSLLKGKLYGTLDIYNKKSTDLIVSQSIASVNGTTSQKFNNGEMLNKGIELKLGTTLPIKGTDITWFGSLNMAYNKNEITSFYKVSYQMYDLYDGGTSAYVEGYNANTLWSLRYAGMDNIGTVENPQMEPTFYGIDDAKLTFLGWPTGDARDYESNEGTKVAPMTLGMTNAFQYRDFNLSFIITAKFGHVFRRQSFNYPAMTGGNTYVNNKYNEVANSDPSVFVPIPEEEYRYYFWDRFWPYLDYLTENASHIRIQEINLTYNVPKRILTKIGLNSLSVYAQANNVGVILFNDYDEDPEYPMGTLKPQAMYTFGIKFNL